MKEHGVRTLARVTCVVVESGGEGNKEIDRVRERTGEQAMVCLSEENFPADNWVLEADTRRMMNR